MPNRDACQRNCWIAGAVLGLVVLVLSTGAGGLGIAGGVFLGLITGGLFGAMLVWLVCDGQPAVDPDLPQVPAAGLLADDATDGATDGAPAVVPVHPVDPSALRAPAGIVAGAVDAAAEGAVTARPGAPQAPTFGRTTATAPAAQPSSPAVATDSPLEDTRAVMDDPARSEDHDMPGESVPAAEPAAPRPAKGAKAAKADKPAAKGTKKPKRRKDDDA